MIIAGFWPGVGDDGEPGNNNNINNNNIIIITVQQL